jgi:cytoskeletal protein CcmA (bactofilin family)
MFTRSATAEPKTLEPVNTNSNVGLNMQQRRPPVATENATKSVIGNDLKIIGQGLKIISQGTLQVDGEVEGDVRGSEVIIGEKGQGDGHRRRRARDRARQDRRRHPWRDGVALQSSSKVEGDIHHMSLAIEQGAEFDGRCRPSQRRCRTQSRSGRRPRQLKTGRGHRAAASGRLAANRRSGRLISVQQRKGGDPMSSGILMSAMTLKLDRAYVGATSSEA